MNNNVTTILGFDIRDTATKQYSMPGSKPILPGMRMFALTDRHTNRPILRPKIEPASSTNQRLSPLGTGQPCAKK
jgi:hypothetical protein